MNRQYLEEFRIRHGKLLIALNSYVFILIGMFIFFRPIPHTTTLINISFYLAIAFALLLFYVSPDDYTLKTPLTYPLMIFFLWALLSISWAIDVRNTINDVRGHLLNHIIFYFLVVNFFPNKKRLDSLVWIIILSAACFSLLGLIYYYFIMDNPVKAVRFGWLMSNSKNVSTELPVNFIGTLNIPAIFFCLYLFVQSSAFYVRIALVLCALPTIIGMILTQSRGTLAAFVLAAVALLVISRKKLIPLCALLTVIIVFLLSPARERLETSSLSERLKMNYVACEVLKDYPLKGIGFGMMTFNNSINKEAYINKIPPKYRPQELITPHNLLLDIAVRIGLVGLSIFFVILYVFIKMCWQTLRYSIDKDIKCLTMYVAVVFVAYFFMGLLEPLFLFKASAMMFFIFLGMMSILWRLNSFQMENKRGINGNQVFCGHN
ncbi:MAG: O-antigen ligase family protein [Desulfobacteraceae bacterium]|nr:O-antigen ligase family protein [Desulfobacteraceae bacterium]